MVVYPCMPAVNPQSYFGVPRTDGAAYLAPMPAIGVQSLKCVGTPIVKVIYAPAQLAGPLQQYTTHNKA